MSLPILTLGETMGLLRATTVGSLAHVSNLELGFGGAESNVAVALTRLGAPVIWLGRVGNDALGDRIVRGLRGEGVDVRAIVDNSASTGVMLKAYRTPESTEVLYYRAGSAGSQLCVEDVDTVDVAACSLLHITGITPSLSDGASHAVAHAIERAKAAGVPISFDVNHRSRLWANRDAAARYREIVAESTVVFAGEGEARLLVPDATTTEQLAHGIAAMGPSEVIIKCGERGAFALVDGREYHRDAIPVRAVDTVGAGDGFVGGYLAERLVDAEVEQRLTTAVTIGAFACLNHNDWEGYPKRSELGLLGAEEPVTR